MYAPELKVRDALKLYFEQAGFGPETYTENWIRLPLGPIHFYLPNIPPRKVVVPLHDVDHVLSEYPTDWQGELEISGYELGTGLGPYWFGWVIDLQGIWLALFVCPRKCFQAFVRGRRSGSLYRKHIYNEDLLNRSVGELRESIPVAPKIVHRVRVPDFLWFVGMYLFSAAIHAPLVLVPAAVIYWYF